MTDVYTITARCTQNCLGFWHTWHLRREILNLFIQFPLQPSVFSPLFQSLRSEPQLSFETFDLLAVDKLYKYVEHVSSLYTVLCPLLQVSLIRRASCWGQGAVLYRYGRRKTVLRLRTVHKRAMYCITEACRKYRFNVFDLFLYPAIVDGYLACSLCCSEICLLTGRCCSWGSCRPWFRRYLLPWFVLNSIIFCIIMCGGQRLTFKWKGSFCVSGLSIGFYQLNTIICCL